MTFVFRLFLMAGLIALLPLSLFAVTDNTASNSVVTAQQLGKMPLAFTENIGQWDEKVKFRANAGGATMWFASDGAFYQFTRSIPKDDPQLGPVDPIHLIDDRMDHEPDEYETLMIKANFVGANPNPIMSGYEMMEYKCNYFIGNDPNEWHTDVPNYQAVLYDDVYAGIDLKYYGNGKQMEYDFIVEPGADFAQIMIEYEGANSVNVNDLGELVVTTDWGQVIEQKPFVYQIIDGNQELVECEYVLIDDNVFSFYMPNGYDVQLALVIDPVITYSTYLGGSGGEWGNDIAVDAFGNAFVTGSTNSTNFPTEGAFQTSYQGAPRDAFVSKLNASGDGLVYSTYIGGDNDDAGTSIALDDAGNAL